jgi:hypothetical protein
MTLVPMSHTVHETTIPAGTRIADYAKGAYFADAWSVTAAEPDLTALGQFIKAVRATPRWVETCMKLRNVAVQFVGLKNLGGLAEVVQDKADSQYKVGDRLGIFTLLEIAPDEVLMGDDDKHLKATLSVSCAKQDNGQILVTVTTVVHVHNLLGKIYMLPVAPMHKLIAPAVAKAIGRVT